MFVKEYLIDLNATQAAIRAKYSKKTAEQQGARLLTNVKVSAAIQKQMDKRAAKIDLTADRVLQEVSHSAFLDPIDLFADDGTLLPLKHGRAHNAPASNSSKTPITVNQLLFTLQPKLDFHQVFIFF